MDASKKTNVAIAAFCTTYARLELYKALDTLQDQVCYMDTDSCIYVSYPGCKEIDLGELLGEWADELLADNAEYMVDAFVALQPKIYGYRMLAVKGKDATRCFLSKDHAKKPYKGACQHTKDVVKAAGLYLNFAATSKVNYDSLTDLITHQENNLEVDGIHEIRASKETRDKE